jgi:hypothetical protein
MKNVTISLDEALIKAGREYAQKKPDIFKCVNQRLTGEDGFKKTNFLRLMVQVGVRSANGINWSREKLHER